MTTKGRSLIVYGFISCIVGFAVMPGFEDWPPHSPITVFPIWLRSFVWILSGVMATWSAWFPRLQRAAVNLLVIMPAARAVSFAIVFVEWVWPGGHSGDPRGLVQCVTYVGIIWGIWLTGRLDRSAAARRLADSVNGDIEGVRRNDHGTA